MQEARRKPSIHTEKNRRGDLRQSKIAQVSYTLEGPEQFASIPAICGKRYVT